jgi:nucleoside-diphosphate-sugar epimerase
MRVFVTGATGFIGSAVVRELLAVGHQVTGLARSDAAEASLVGAGAGVVRGELSDLDILRRSANDADGVIHTAFIHDFSNFEASVQADKCAIEALGSALANSGRPLVVAAGVAMIAPGRVATEDDVRDPGVTFPRVSEEVALASAARGVRASVMRLPPSVHGKGDHGFVARLVAIAQEKGSAAYVGDGLNRWSAVHRNDAARLFRLALEKAPPGTKLHAIGDEGIPMLDIAESIGRELNVPVVSKSVEDAPEHFGWIAHFVGIDAPASSARTQERFGWQPVQPGLLADMHANYFSTKSGSANGGSLLASH